MGAREVGFTVLSMSLSLIAVFMPILLMGGIVGRLFREFASPFRRDPDFAGGLADHHADDVRALSACKTSAAGPGSSLSTHIRASEHVFIALQRAYDRALVLGAAITRLTVMLILLATIVLNIYLFVIDPEGLFPAAGYRHADGQYRRPTRAFRSS